MTFEIQVSYYNPCCWGVYSSSLCPGPQDFYLIEQCMPINGSLKKAYLQESCDSVNLGYGIGIVTVIGTIAATMDDTVLE